MPSSFRPDHAFLILIVTVFIATHLPFLPFGFGSEEDSWRVARAATSLSVSGTYEVSRFPGYPLHEILSSFLIPTGGALLSNLGTLAAGVVSIFLFGYLVRSLPHRHILVAAFAFTPLFWISSSGTIDYVWSLLFLLAALIVLESGRALAAGILLGAAIGFRPSNAVALLPLLMFAYASGRTWKSMFLFTLVALLASLFSFLPVWNTYGFSTWLSSTLQQAEKTAISWSDKPLYFLYRSTYSIGPLALIPAAFVMFKQRSAIFTSLRDGAPLIWTSFIGLVTFLGLFFVFPLERAYLLPALPFFLIVVGSFASRRTLLLLTACLISFGFVNPDVVRHGNSRGTPEFNIHEGTFFSEWEVRQRIERRRSTVVDHSYKDSTVVITGMEESLTFQHPLLVLDEARPWNSLIEPSFHHRERNSIHFVQLLTSDEIAFLGEHGFHIVVAEYALPYAPQKQLEVIPLR